MADVLLLRRSMESHAKVAGHPIHPMLVMFPLGLWPSAVVFELIGRASGAPIWATMAYYMIAAGILGAIAAAIPGLVDALAIPRGTRAKRIAVLHGVGNVIVLVAFVASWWLRRGIPENPPISATLLAIAGVLLAAVTGWLGGELVDRLGVGVDDAAGLDAPSSLQGPHGSHPPHAPSAVR